MESWRGKKLYPQKLHVVNIKTFSLNFTLQKSIWSMLCLSLRGLQHATMCKMHHSLPLPWCTDKFQSRWQKLNGWQKLNFTVSWGFREISGNA